MYINLQVISTVDLNCVVCKYLEGRVVRKPVNVNPGLNVI